MRSILLPRPPSSMVLTRRAAVLVLMLFGCLLTAACGDIAVRDNTPTSPPPAGNSARQSTANSSETVHDLAILGVDFDPPLDMERIINHDQVKMVVGVMNFGNYRESRVQVKASLWDADQRLVLARAEQTIESIAAGDVIAARLLTRDTPPVYSRYKLVVEIVPLANEADTDNNHRTLDILVNTTQ